MANKLGKLISFKSAERDSWCVAEETSFPYCNVLEKGLADKAEANLMIKLIKEDEKAYRG